MELPSLLNGAKNPDQWILRRQEIKHILQTEIYGNPVPALQPVVTETCEETICAGKGIHTGLRLRFPELDDFSFPVEVLRPLCNHKVPTFIFLNFRPDIYDKYLPTEEILDRGFAVVRIFYEDVTADNDDFTDGLAGALHIDRTDATAPGKIALWAWAASRGLDAVENCPWIDKDHVAVMGHSRLGKTALLAGGYDERFRYVFSNDSGCSGAAITRGKVGESVADICRVFGYWFCENYKKYTDNEDAMPFDQHFLLSLTAPRILGVHSARLDTWSDPEAEERACKEASSAWELYGKYCAENVHYHLRSGEHYLSRWDWNRFMDVVQKDLNFSV